MNVIIAKGVKSYGLSQKPVGLLTVKLKRLLGFGTCNLVSHKHLFYGHPRCLQKVEKGGAHMTV